MSDDIEAQRETFRQMNKTAFVLGYTGETGKELVKELLKSKIFSRVTLIGRRIVNYEDELYKDVVSLCVSVWIETERFKISFMHMERWEGWYNNRMYFLQY